ncbi:MarR family transcriptional regulator [Isobaculum melis]|uniref:MarR family protein n=1 Tax=Isobaculum melis TaxID=142588 RepID=A0A1H9SWD8_9LACT|nr:MarR family transcriptional regulator [Isobaculum melis]SER89216.1 MarR family protein [Isobaculum melis]
MTSQTSTPTTIGNKEQYYRQYIYHLSKAFWKAIEDDWDNLLKYTNLSIHEYTILTFLNANGNLTISALAQLGLMHISTAQNASHKLQKANYLTLQKSTIDKRTTYATITDKGRKILGDIEQKWDKTDSTLFEKTTNMSQFFGQEPDFREVAILLKSYYGESLFSQMILEEESLATGA